MHKITLKYFKTIDKDKLQKGTITNTRKLLQHGVYVKGLPQLDDEVTNMLLEMYGFDLQNANATFYSSYAERLEKDWVEVVIDRLTHYWSNGLYIPNEVDTTVNEYITKHMVTIECVDSITMKNMINKFVREPFAIPTSDVDEFVQTLRSYKIYSVPGNKQIMIKLATDTGFVIADPHLFFRQLVYLVTDSTELVKSKAVIDHFDFLLSCASTAKREKIAAFILVYEEDLGLVDLAKHFRPNKQLWLLLRKYIISARPAINKIKRLSEKVHVDHTPETIFDKDESVLQEMSIYQLIKVFNYLQEHVHMNVVESDNLQLYRIRNGKVFIKEYNAENRTEKAIELLQSIAMEFRRRYQDKDVSVYLGGNQASIKMPTSGKNFIGSYPMYTSFPIKTNTQVGFYWDADKDLDLHAKGLDGSHIGFYSEASRNVVYSGDMVRLNKQGLAAEGMLILDPAQGSYAFNMSPFSTRGSKPGYTLFVGDGKVVPRRDGIIHKDQIVFHNHIESDEPLTFAVSLSDQLVLTNFSVGGFMPDETTSQALISLVERKEQCSLSLHEFCMFAGIEITNEKKENSIDFSMEGVSTNSFIELLVV